MTVEVRVIPMGVSGIKKKAAKKTTKPNPVQAHPGEEGTLYPTVDRNKAVGKVIKRMERENQLENKRLSDKQIRQLLRQQMIAGNPEKSSKEIDELVNQRLPKVMEAYRGAPALTPPEPTEELKAIWAARSTERRRVVKANRLRRKADQPMSKADRAWVAAGR